MDFIKKAYNGDYQGLQKFYDLEIRDFISNRRFYNKHILVPNIIGKYNGKILETHTYL